MAIYTSPFGKDKEDENKLEIYNPLAGTSSGSQSDPLADLQKGMQRAAANAPAEIDPDFGTGLTGGERVGSMDDLDSIREQLIQRIASDPELSQAEFLTADAALAAAARGESGGDVPFWQKALGLGGSVVGKAADIFLETPRRGVQAGLGTLIAGIETAATQGADVFSPLTEGISVQEGIASGAPRNLPVSSAVIKKSEDTSYGFKDLFNDPEFRLTVPNVRDIEALQNLTGFAPADWAIRNIGFRSIDFLAESGLTLGTDPWTYLTFGQTQWLGASGRAALATRLLEKDARAVMPSIVDKIDDIYRFGEFGLTLSERRALVQAGILERGGIQFAGSATIPFTERAAQVVGVPVTRARAGLGSVVGRVGDDAIGKLYTPQSRYDLLPVARGKVTGEEGARKVKVWAASQAARGAAAEMNARAASKYKDLIKELAESDVRLDLGSIIEGQIDPTGLTTEQLDLAMRLSGAFEDIRQMYNQYVSDYISEFGLDPEYVRKIAQLDDVNDYFYHTLTPKALRWSLRPENATKESAKTLNFMSAELGGLDGPVLGRKLRAGQTFLGETLDNGSLDEINRISMEKLGFEWFETDAATVFASYINSVTRQAKRVSFVTRLFDFGDDTIRPILKKIIPDEVLLREANKSLDSFNREINTLTRVLTGASQPTQAMRDRGISGAKDARSVLNRVKNLAQNISNNGVRELDKAEDKMLNALTRLNQVRNEIAAKKAAAETAEENIRKGYEQVLNKIDARLIAIESAIEAGKGAREVARQALVKEFKKMYPRRAVPKDIKVLADAISGANQRRFARKIKQLQTQKERAGRRVSKAKSKAAGVEEELSALDDATIQLNERVAALREMDDIDYDWEIFPDGLMYTSRQQLESAARGEQIDLYPAYDDLVEPVVAFPAPAKTETYDLTSDLDAVRDMLTTFGDTTALFFEDPNGFNDPFLANSFRNEYNRLIESPRNTPVAPDTPEEIRGLLQVVVGWGYQEEAAPDIALTYMSMMADELYALHVPRNIEVDPFHLVEGLINDAVQMNVTTFGQGAGGRAVAVIPDVEYGGTKFVGDGAELQRVFGGETDSVFANIEQGTPKWDDFVPERSVIEPVVEPTVTPEPAAPATPTPITNGVSVEDARRVIGNKGVFVRAKDRAPVLNDFFKEAKKLNDFADPDKQQAAFDKLYNELTKIDALDEKAELYAKVLNTDPKLLTGKFGELAQKIEDLFSIQVEFFIGVAAAGVDDVLDDEVRATLRNWARNWISLREPEDFANDFGGFITDAARAVNAKKPAPFVQQLSDEAKDQIRKAADDVAAGTPSAMAAAPEPTLEPPDPTGLAGLEKRLRSQNELMEQVEGLTPQRGLLQTQLGELGTDIAAEEAAEKAVGRKIAGTKGAEAKAEKKIADLRSAATNRKSVELNGESLSIKQANELTRAERAKLDGVLKQIDDEIAADPAVKSYKDKSNDQKLQKTSQTFEAAYQLRDDAQLWVDEVKPLVDQDIETIDALIKDMPAGSPAGTTASAWMRRVRDLGYQLNTDDLLTQDPALQAAWQQATSGLFVAEADLARLEAQRAVTEKLVKDIADGTVGAVIVKDILKGWKELEGLGVQVPQELYDEMYGGLRRIADPKEWSRAMQMYLKYQRFFKTYAIATPGFTVRNALTAVFNNMVAQVSWKDMSDSVKFAYVYRRRGYEAAINSIKDPAERALYEEGYRVVGRSGGGQAVDELMPLVKGQGSRVYNNAYTRWFQSNNEAVEIAARMSMAVDGLRKGMTPDQSAARVTRYHFDYSDLSRLDRIAKTWIPFWTFASRNIQLQIVNQFVRPKWYSRYEALRRTDSQFDTSLYPLWIRERDPLGIGQNLVLDMDLPHVDMEEKIQQLLDPRRLVSMSNPLIRTTFEAVTGESTAFAYPYSTKPRDLGYTDLPSAAIAALPTAMFGGSLTQGGEGAVGLQAGEFVQNLAPSLIPPLQQLQRLLKPVLSEDVQTQFGGDPRYAERDPFTTFGTFAGLPVRQITPTQMQSELRRMEFLMRDIARNAGG